MHCGVIGRERNQRYALGRPSHFSACRLDRRENVLIGDVAMSGVRQHFIPRFLQKGFRIPGNGKVIRSWIYERHRETCPANIKTIGFEGHFYALETEPDLDDRISKAEEDYSPLAERLRRGELDGESTREIPPLLAHFEIRSRHVRKNMESASVACVSYIMQRLIPGERSALDVRMEARRAKTTASIAGRLGSRQPARGARTKAKVASQRF